MEFNKMGHKYDRKHITWTTLEGKVLTPAQMDTSHIKNCIKHLEKRSELLFGSNSNEEGKKYLESNSKIYNVFHEELKYREDQGDEEASDDDDMNIFGEF